MSAKSFDLIGEIFGILDKLSQVSDADVAEYGNAFDRCSPGGTLVGKLSIQSQRALTQAYLNESRMFSLSQDISPAATLSHEAECARLLAENTLLRHLPEYEIKVRFAEMAATHGIEMGEGYEIRSYPLWRRGTHGARSSGERVAPPN